MVQQFLPMSSNGHQKNKRFFHFDKFADMHPSNNLSVQNIVSQTRAHCKKKIYLSTVPDENSFQLHGIPARFMNLE